jgi:hypothetical protein
VANSSRKGWWLANITRTRRVLRRIAAPIFSSRMRMVAAPARCSSVSCSAKARDIWGASFKTLEEATACFYERQADLERGIGYRKFKSHGQGPRRSFDGLKCLD